MSFILFVAPFEDVAKAAKKVIKEKGIDVPVIVSQENKVFEDIRVFQETDVIISRGGIAEQLKQLPGKTIVEVNSSFNDILIAIEKLAQRGCKSIGVVMRDNILNNFSRNFSFAGIQVFVRPCESYEKVEQTVEYLYGNGIIDGLAGCSLTVKIAKEKHIINEYVTSGEKSLERAIDEALRIIGRQRQEKLQLEQLNAIIHNIQEGVVVFSEDDLPVFYNKIANRIFGHEPVREWYKKVGSSSDEKYLGEKLMEIDGNKVLMRTIPLHIENRLKKEVFIFQEVKRIEKSEQKIRISIHNKGLYAKKHFSDSISYSPQMKTLLELAEKFAQAEANVLIYGETGTGKEGMVQSIHNASRRAQYPFVSVNCASLPPNLIESELFGYVEGAFTGARHSGKKGLFELAHRGTIFLDEIGELPLDIQSRLLRVLQEHEIMRIGDDKILPLDIRVICATNKDLQQLVNEGRFREDLYYRINVFKIHLPALRERKEDILPIMQFYLQKFTQTKTLKTEFSKKAKEMLLSYGWPGNIRELRNVAEVLAFYQQDHIDEMLLKSVFVDAGNESIKNKPIKKIELPLEISLKEAQKEIVRQMLEVYSPEEVCGNLGISRVTLWRKLQK